MTKILVVAAISLAIASSAAWGAIYKCQTQNGAIIFTDDPSQTSADCTVERTENLPAINVLPESAPQESSPQESTSMGTSVNNSAGEKSFEVFSNEVDLLVKDFRSLRRLAFHGTAYYKYQARHKLVDIRAQKNLLLSEIEGSSLRRGEKEELLEKLAAITE